jgi:capsular polysaccharide biosynthesis protein
MVYIRREALQIRQFRDAVATPFELDLASRTHRGAIYDANGLLVPWSVRVAGGKPKRLQSACLSYVAAQGGLPVIEGHSLYLGHFMSHFGHWLTEGISSLWAARGRRPDQLLFHPFTLGRRFAPFMRPFLEAHGVADLPIKFVDRKIRLERVTVPERSLFLSHSAHPEYLRIIERTKRHVGAVGKNDRRVFLSRARLTVRPARKETEIANAGQVDEVAAALGLEIVYPELLPIDAQIRLAAQCSTIAGFSGSALHLSIFGGRHTRVIELGDLRTRRGALPMQALLNALAGAHGIFVPYKAAAATEPNVADLDYVAEGLRAALAQRAPSRTLTLIGKAHALAARITSPRAAG